MKLPSSAGSKRHLLLAVAGVAILVIVVLTRSLTSTRSHSTALSTFESNTTQKGPPWIYGAEGARFTIVQYADFQCPYCREYFPTIQQWIAEHPNVNLQWHHLPLAMHEPGATRLARVAECAGETGGNAAFWKAVAWLYERRGGQTADIGAEDLPGMSPAIQTCLQNNRPDALIQSQAEAAARDQITVTPTLRLIDRQTGKTLTLHGPVEGDALLSAIDLLIGEGEPPLLQ